MTGHGASLGLGSAVVAVLTALGAHGARPGDGAVRGASAASIEIRGTITYRGPRPAPVPVPDAARERALVEVNSRNHS